MVFGESVNLPMRVILNNLAAEFRPHSSSAQFTELWQKDLATPHMMDTVFNRWRARSLNPEGKSIAAIAATMGNMPSTRGARSTLRRRAPAAQPHRPAAASGSLAAQAREKLQAQAKAAQALAAAQAAKQAQSQPSRTVGSLNDVKNKLNSAFHRNL